MVSVAVCVPTESPAAGVTEKTPELPAAMVLREVVSSVKLLASSPESAAVMVPEAEPALL